MSERLLGGVRILSLATFVAGNICPLLLAELGADVVKIEDRHRPDPLRAYEAPHQAEVVEPSGLRNTALYAGLTRSMRSICLEMATVEGREVFRRLVGQVDVLIENLRPGKLASWGCSEAELHSLNPDLVVVSISGYGRTGPLADFRAYASNINNYVGLTEAWALDGTHFDFVAGFHGASAVLAGLAAADEGACVAIDMAQTEAAATVMAPLYLDFLANGRASGSAPNEVPGSWLSAVVPCRGDDAWLAVELEDAADWDRLCEHIEQARLRLDGEQATPERRAALTEALGAWAGSRTPMQAANRLQQAGLAAGPVQNGEDLWRDPQHRARGAFTEVWHPDMGMVEYPTTPSRLSDTPGRITRRGPRLGEHTGEVLTEWLGLPVDEVVGLLARGSVWQPEVTAGA